MEKRKAVRAAYVGTNRHTMDARTIGHGERREPVEGLSAWLVVLRGLTKGRARVSPSTLAIAVCG